jgi:glycosyltransferase involved in cell wall biosynthesis
LLWRDLRPGLHPAARRRKPEPGVRVAILHSRYLSGDASGENRAVADDIQLLRQAGHELTSWTPSPSDSGAIAEARSGVSAVWSSEGVRQVRRLVREWGADIVHFHNLFPLVSPAAVREAGAEGAGIVMTLHNYRLMCLPASLLRDGRPCEDCVGRSPWAGVVHSCYRDSRLGSGALATALSVHRRLGSFERIHQFLAVSEFVRAKHVKAGFAAQRLRVAPQFAWPTTPREGPGDYFLYLGRLAENKGAATLMQAWPECAGRLLVVGDGPQMSELRAMAPGCVEFRGLVAGEAVPGLLRGARALLVPSLVYDAAPRAVAEAYAAGVPVLASRIGGLPEVVREDESGMLITPGAVEEWGEAIERLADDEVSVRLGAGALALWHERHRPELSLGRLESAYAAALEDRGRAAP